MINEIKGKKPRAVALVLGFAGAKPRHIAKYTDLYNQKGCSTVSGTATNYDIFTGNNAGLDVFALDGVEQVTKVLRQADGGGSSLASGTLRQDTPVVMHIISNGGAFVTRQLGLMLDKRDSGDDLDLFAERLQRGYQVFDSAPGYVDLKASFNVIKHLMPNQLIGIPTAVLFCLTTYFPAMAMSTVSGRKNAGDLFWEDLLHDTNCTRQAFLYSASDDIVSAEKVQEFAKERKRRGVHIMTHRFEESVHVQHLRQHKTEYSEFIENVLVDMEGKNAKAAK